MNLGFSRVSLNKRVIVARINTSTHRKSRLTDGKQKNKFIKLLQKKKKITPPSPTSPKLPQTLSLHLDDLLAGVFRFFATQIAGTASVMVFFFLV